MTHTEAALESRRGTNPLFNDNRLKLGVFCANSSNGTSFTLADGRLLLTWEATRAIATLADGAGFEAQVPIARWRGLGGQARTLDITYEPYTWAAALAPVTQHTALFATSHVPLYHPVKVAKMAATIDHVSGGRFALNVVCGRLQDELEMFEAPHYDHDTWYEYATEWLDVLKRLWTEEEFRYEGRFFHIKRGFSLPKPLQQPWPAIMNAGSSPVGRRWAAQHADIVFTNVPNQDFGQVATQVRMVRNLAAEYGREVQVWISTNVICRPTEREAQAYVEHCVAHADWEGIDRMMRDMGHLERLRAQGPEAIERMRREVAVGRSAVPLVGTPEQIVDRLQCLARDGVDGIVLTCVDYLDELRRWIADVLPLMEQAGLRQPFQPTAEAPAG